MKGQKVQLRVTEVNRARRRVVGSIRSVADEARKAAQEAVWGNIEIDGLLTEYFKDHAYITTKEMQYLCGLSNHTALRRLKQRVEEGRMTHPGHIRSAFYFPVPGNYGVSVDKNTTSAP